MLLAGSQLVDVVAGALRWVAGSGAETLGRAASLLFLAHAVLIGGALLAWPLAPSDGNARRRRALDALVFAASLSFILWALGWGALYRGGEGAAADKVLTLAFPATYVGLVALAVYLGARQVDRFRGPLGWLAAALLLSFLGNLAWGYLVLRGAYRVGHLIDPLSHVISLLMVGVTFSPRPVAGRGDRPGARAAAAGGALPYVPLLAALAIWAGLLARGEGGDPVLAWIVLAMVLLLLARQFLALRDVTLLTSGLEAQVADRTRALQESMAALMRTQRMNLVATVGAGLAHDFRNLLSVVKSSAELTRAELARGRAPTAADLEAIEAASRKALELSSRLVAIGRGQDAPAVDVDLAAHVRDSERLLRALAHPPIRLEIDADQGPLCVRGDPLKVQQLLVNLVANARDAMPAGGGLSVSAARDAVTGDPLLQVSDTGTGMPPEISARVFEPFFTTKEPGKGTGLGLASVKAIVDSMGGTIALESAPGRGTTFVLRWPAPRPAPALRR